MTDPANDAEAPAPVRAVISRAAFALVWSERVIFFAIGLLLFVAALALLKQCVPILGTMFVGGKDIAAGPGAAFLDLILLVLMIVELAYTVILSLRGEMLSPEPFLIIGLIAVIRRILVITVGESHQNPPTAQHTIGELGILTVVVIVFVASIVVLRVRPKPKNDSGIELAG